MTVEVSRSVIYNSRQYYNYKVAFYNHGTFIRIATGLQLGRIGFYQKFLKLYDHFGFTLQKVTKQAS